MRQALIGAVLIAVVSTAGDFVWATLIPRHMPRYGLTHGALLFLCVGVYLGALAGRPLDGAVGGAALGLLAAGSFYVLAPIVGDSVMFVSWCGVWIALAFFNGWLPRRPPSARDTVIRGIAAAALSGIAFYLVSTGLCGAALAKASLT